MSERDDRALVWASAALAGGLALHADRVPPWVTAIALLLMLWRLGAARARVPVPGAWLRALFAAAFAFGVLARFHTLNGLAAGTSLLILMSALKLLETQRQRDRLVVVGAGVFLLLAACLDREGLERVPLYLAETWLCCAALAVVATPGFAGGAALRLAGRTLLLAVPLAVLLFMFFPRLAGAFWALPRGEEALTGLSDTMSPGEIAKLTTSYDIAFRATFSGELPPPVERYWRGPVLHDFDGATWTRGGGDFRVRPALDFSGPAYRYKVTLEPSRHRFWFPLDIPAESPSSAVRLTHDYELLAARPVEEPTRFEGLSYPRAASRSPLSRLERTEDTYPGPGNPRAVALANELRDRPGTDDAAFVRAVLEYLRTGGFVYSLEPERLGANQIDDFLFRTRTGFCGHYASAFVVLMRAGGVPARVVTGYLGGEWNPIGGYLVVRQSDAHAWAEVWIEGRGWLRVDPTAVVEPARLERGLFDLMPQAMSAETRLLRASPWLTRLLERWDAANAWWNDRVVKFDYSTQLDLLAWLGIHEGDARKLGWAFALALLGWLAVIAWHIGRSEPPPPLDPLARLYARLCRKLAHTGVSRAPHQGPLAYSQALRAGHPALAEGAHGLLMQYAQLRYGAPDPATRVREIGELARAVRRLRIARA
jgi:protein-glutamine gamma-glutamyltransferase